MSNVVKRLMGGNIIQKWFGKYIGFIFFVVLLLVLLITLRYNIEGEVREINKLSKEINELQKRSLKVKTTYQTTTQMTYINSRLESTGIAISTEPIKDIIVYDDKTEQEK
ncbi:MAG: hypothetical protein IJ180_09875 [Bacteroidales bacterium]|nr:hypothetical protein [Bacteroidales bacterium]